MRHRAISLRMAVACGAFFALQTGQAAADSRVVVELFTSQGCSSCPAADKLLSELAKDPAVLAMSLSVDYWDYLGWKDTLALPGHAKRQRSYAGARGDRAIYTPQVVINGVTHVLGSDKAAIEGAIKQARAVNGTPLPVTVKVADGKINVDVPAGHAGQTGEVWLCRMNKKVPVQVSRGENRGHTITYTNVVRGWVKLGDWSGRAQSFSKPLADLALGDVDAVAVLVQAGGSGSPGPVHGAATASLR